MSRPPRPAAPPTTVVADVDMRTIQERIIAQLQEAEQQLAAAEQALEQAKSRVWMLRGQLDLSAQLATQVQRAAGGAPKT